MINGNQLQEAMRKIKCTSKDTFIELFGEDAAEELWNYAYQRIDQTYSGLCDASNMICHMDERNLKILADYLNAHMEKYNVK